MSDQERHDEGVTATVNQPSPGTDHAGEPGRNGRARESFGREPQARSAYLVGVLARALATQVDELARSSAQAPDGWWFAEPERPDGRTENR